MAPGDSWDSEQGFARADFDWYADRDAHLEELADIAQPAITRSQHEESTLTLTFAEFESFFNAFVQAVPPLSGRLAVKRPVVFRLWDVPDAPCWAVDVRARKVYETDAPPEDRASIIEIDRGVLADAIANSIVHYIHISMRFHGVFSPGRSSDDLAFWGLLAFYELGYLPMRRLVRPRMLAAIWRRRSEFLAAARAAISGSGSFADRMSSQLVTDSDDQGADDAPDEVTTGPRR